VITHERAGTHFGLNLFYRNLYVKQNFYDLEVYKKASIDGESIADHWQANKRKVDIAMCHGGLIKSHCEYQLFRKYLPELPVIYIVRDPRDTLVSFYHYLNRPEFHCNNPGFSDLRCDNFSEFLRRPLNNYLRFACSLEGNMFNVVQRWARHYAGWKNESSCYIMRYEDLLEKMVQSVWRIAIFTKVFPKLFMRSYKVGENGAILPRKGIVGDWKNHFSNEDLEWVLPL
jgi:hypothetical protein